MLTVAGERRDEREASGRGWHRIERSFGSFQRQLTLPEGVDPDTVTAEFDRGVLTVSIPKPERVKPRRIAIGDAGNGDAAHTAVAGTARER